MNSRIIQLVTYFTMSMVLAFFASSAHALNGVHDSHLERQVDNLQGAVTGSQKAMEEVRKIQDQTLEAIGQSGPQTLEEAYGQNWAPFKDGGAFLAEMKFSAPNACQLTDCDKHGVQNVNFTSYSDILDFISNVYYLHGEDGFIEQQELRLVRDRAAQYTSINALAVALLSREYAAQEAERSAALEEIVASASNLREEVRANSAVALAGYQQMGQLLALYSIMAENMSVAGVGSSAVQYLDGAKTGSGSSQ